MQKENTASFLYEHSRISYLENGIHFSSSNSLVWEVEWLLEEDLTCILFYITTADLKIHRSMFWHLGLHPSEVLV